MKLMTAENGFQETKMTVHWVDGFVFKILKNSLFIQLLSAIPQHSNK